MSEKIKIRNYFNDDQINQLGDILGRSEMSESYINDINFSIELTKTDRPFSNKERSDYLEKLSKEINKILPLLGVINTERSLSLQETIFKYDNSKDKLLSQEIVGHIIQDNDLNIDESSKYFSYREPTFQHLINELSSVMDSANKLRKETFIPKKGDLSEYESGLQTFELNIVNSYLDCYKCLPAKTNSGAFHRALSVIYEVAGYNITNTYQRMTKAINRHQNYFIKSQAQDLRPIRGLHPNR
jgi:hypothetical protein